MENTEFENLILLLENEGTFELGISPPCQEYSIAKYINQK